MVDVPLEKQQFFLEGSKSYLSALRAIKEYQDIIDREIENALENKLKNLSEALKLDNQISAKSQYTYQNLNEGYCYIGKNFDIPDCGRCYVLARITEDGLFAVTIVGASYASWRNRIMGFVNKEPDLNRDFKNDFQNEIYTQKKVDPEYIQEFRDKISETIDLWIQFWERVGGTKFLKDA